MRIERGSVDEIGWRVRDLYRGGEGCILFSSEGGGRKGADVQRKGGK